MKFIYLFLQSVIIFIIVVSSSSIFSAEVDSFKNRHVLIDSRIKLNIIVNNWMVEAVESANQPVFQSIGNDDENVLGDRNLTCKKERLYSALKNRFTGFIAGQLEECINKDAILDSPRIDSIKVDFLSTTFII